MAISLLTLVTLSLSCPVSGGAGVAAVHFVDEVVDGVGHAGYLRGDAGLVGAESLVLDRVEGRHDEIELAAVVRHSLDGGIDGRQPGLEGGVLVVEDTMAGPSVNAERLDLFVEGVEDLEFGVQEVV
uniref:hypothetical protein n=1 Tax=Candidatus Cryptobacteroides bacterium TaxID=3085639 RepID=UPI004029A2A2